MNIEDVGISLFHLTAKLQTHLTEIPAYEIFVFDSYHSCFERAFDLCESKICPLELPCTIVDNEGQLFLSQYILSFFYLACSLLVTKRFFFQQHVL